MNTPTIINIPDNLLQSIPQEYVISTSDKRYFAIGCTGDNVYNLTETEVYLFGNYKPEFELIPDYDNYKYVTRPDIWKITNGGTDVSKINADDNADDIVALSRDYYIFILYIFILYIFIF